ncbi:hypothetical protein [Roseibium suaedae]|uniref:Uncharacterized protein n=1 Tax=Roseibium suaedae TaxID=735517 RepID=A0A1M7NR25_9HYPH|nr:hypothetical protein [Roseibium suaedae]SHN06266.1 hypothetical protein SAMN05444272_3909 [Roseibium suaedae]
MGNGEWKANELILSLFSIDEFSLRRLWISHPEFKSLCEDYTIANCALEHWLQDATKSQDYRDLVEELGQEIYIFLGEHGIQPKEIWAVSWSSQTGNGS